MQTRKTSQPQTTNRLTRRQFLGSAAAAAGFSVIPGSILAADGTAPNSKTTVGIIGVGGQGTWDMQQLLEFPEIQVVAVADPAKRCDYSGWWYKTDRGTEPARQAVEEHYAQDKAAGTYKGCTEYADFRQMLENEDLDAVLVATTDNLHAPASIAAMKKGLHCYCEKPLTYTIHEAREMARIAKEKNLATQMGNAGQASEQTRRTAEFIADGAIGKVLHVHDWTNRPVWPQGLPRPTDTPPVPDWLKWDLWLGPAPYRPYNPAYLPVQWRGWWDFGTGALGDMGCHTFDPIFRAVKFAYPVAVEACFTTPVLPGLKEYVTTETYPHSSIVRYEFPARGDMPAARLSWYDGGMYPQRPDELEEGRRMRNNGVMYVGDAGVMLDGRIIPESKQQAYEQPPKTLPRSPGHYNEWVNACRGASEKPGANFEFAAVVTETVLLGNIALRFPNTRLKYDAEKMQITNLPEANEFLHRKYREGWTL
jgi:predicted dehydrogenase